MTFSKSQIITAAGVIAGLLGGWLMRHDYQTVTARDVQNKLESQGRAIEQLRLAQDRANAYALSTYGWNMQVSSRMGWPMPPKPEFFLPAAWSVPADGVLFTPAVASENP